MFFLKISSLDNLIAPNFEVYTVKTSHWIVKPLLPGVLKLDQESTLCEYHMLNFACSLGVRVDRAPGRVQFWRVRRRTGRGQLPKVRLVSTSSMSKRRSLLVVGALFQRSSGQN